MLCVGGLGDRSSEFRINGTYAEELLGRRWNGARACCIFFPRSFSMYISKVYTERTVFISLNKGETRRIGNRRLGLNLGL